MRVIGGSRRSLPLKSVPGEKTRPTQDRIRETLFNILSPYVPGSLFIDLFSGTGALGMEALSRGASHCYFVEKSRAAAGVIKENLAFTRFEQESTLFRMDVMNGISCCEETVGGACDIIFMDPPYHEGYEEPVIERLSGSCLISPETLVIIEADIKTDFSYAEKYNFSVFKNKEYKTSKHVFLKRKNI